MPALIGLFLAQDVDKLIAKTGEQKNYSFKITEGKNVTTGVFEGGAMYSTSGGTEVAGTNKTQLGNIGKGWGPLKELVETNKDNATLQRLAATFPPHVLLRELKTYGLSGDLRGNVKDLVKAPWIGRKDLAELADLSGKAKLTASGELISKVELTFASQGKTVATVALELSGFGTAKIPDEIIKKIGGGK